MSEDTSVKPDTPRPHWLVAAAQKLLGGLVAAACARTWMPGTCSGMTSGGSLLGEHEPKS